MSEKIIFIEIFQPFAQYKNPFTFYYAQTFPLPPKSTIIGMLQNACDDWYGNNYGSENWWNLKVSVHGGFESIFWNYQNLIKGELDITKDGIWVNRNDDNPGGKIFLPLYGRGLTSKRTPVYQQELFNGHLYIFIRGDKNLIDKIKNSLEKTSKILYLGRSEDIVFIKKIDQVKPKTIFNNVEDFVKLNYPTFILERNYDKKFPIKNQKFPVFSIPIKVLFQNNGINVKHKSEIKKSTERIVEFKCVIYTGCDYDIILKDKVCVEVYEVDGKEFRIIKNWGWL